MKFRLRFSTFSALTLGLALYAAPARADVFSWSNITYAPAAPVAPATQNALTDLGSGGGTNDIKVQMTLNSGAQFITAVASPTTSTYNTNTTYYTGGGGNGDQKFLQIGGNMVAGGNIGSITVTIFFAKPVINCQFTFFDVDTNATGGNPYADKISNIVGVGTDANKSAVYLSTLQSSGSTPTNTVSGSGATFQALANANNNNGLNNGNVTATFGNTPISQFSYTYGDGLTAVSGHGTAQITALSDLTFSYQAVPEPGTMAMMAFGVFGAAGVAFRRRSK